MHLKNRPPPIYTVISECLYILFMLFQGTIVVDITLGEHPEFMLMYKVRYCTSWYSGNTVPIILTGIRVL